MKLDFRITERDFCVFIYAQLRALTLMAVDVHNCKRISGFGTVLRTNYPMLTPGTFHTEGFSKWATQVWNAHKVKIEGSRQG